MQMRRQHFDVCDWNAHRHVWLNAVRILVSRHFYLGAKRWPVPALVSIGFQALLRQAAGVHHWQFHLLRLRHNNCLLQEQIHFGHLHGARGHVRVLDARFDKRSLRV